MIIDQQAGWKKFLDGYPWYRCKDCFHIPAYSEYMPSPMPDFKPYGESDHSILTEDDLFGWKITELEEENELKPGIRRIGLQIVNKIINLGRGKPEHSISGHGGENLRYNPYWPSELAERAGSLQHERFVTVLPLMLSRTQDDKGRVIWTFFGNSIYDPEQAFWKSFYVSPFDEIPGSESFFTSLISEIYSEPLSDKESLFNCGFRILSSGSFIMPAWTGKFLVDYNSSYNKIKYLLTFKPFELLPEAVKNQYLSGEMYLLPFPGSLVFWGMPGYLKLKQQLPVMAQIPLLNLVGRNSGINGLRVSQAGWLHEPHAGEHEIMMNENLIHESFNRTHRWQRLHRYQDEINDVANEIKLTKALFSTEPDAMGLYNKPMASNSQIWSDNFELILNGPTAGRSNIMEAEKKLLESGLFGYRFFYPPMRVGKHEIYLHRPLVAFKQKQSDEVMIRDTILAGYITGYHEDDQDMSDPVELWPRILRREPYTSALQDFNTQHDHYLHQTSLNIISLLESQAALGNKPLMRSFAYHLLNVSKQKSLEEWLQDLDIHSTSAEKASSMHNILDRVIEPNYDFTLPTPLTYPQTANREFETAWWNDIRFLSQGEFIYKDNADIMLDEATLHHVVKNKRDTELVGNYFLMRYRKLIEKSEMTGKAITGEMPFKWDTLFDFSFFGGWAGNRQGTNYERNIIMIIPGKNRKQAVVFADHYDTAYMEDIYEKNRGGSGARLAAKGADDNYSASATLLQAAPVFIDLSKQGKLERDIWLIHLTGEEFPSDCMGARNLCQKLVERSLVIVTDGQKELDLSETEIIGLFVMDMIGHNRDNDRDIFQISPGESSASLKLARQAHFANMIWNESVNTWNQQADRLNRNRGKRITQSEEIPETARFLSIKGEVRTRYNPHSSLFNTDGQIFSDVGVPVVLFMENYDINRSGYHDTRDTLENIDLDYGAALAAIAIETVARVATLKD